MESDIVINDAEILLEARADGFLIPFLTQSKNKQVFILNSHTFSEADFKAVGEVLLCPRPLGLLDLPKSWVNTVRSVFNHQLDVTLDAPARVTMQPLRNGNIVLHNYNQEETQVLLSEMNGNQATDLFSNQEVSLLAGRATITMKPRSRIWLSKK